MRSLCKRRFEMPSLTGCGWALIQPTQTEADFGRRSLDLPLDALAASLELQISTLRAIAISEGAQLAFVKPHGALYNDMVRDSLLADTVIRTSESNRSNPRPYGACW